jgi:hypothetical protein
LTTTVIPKSERIKTVEADIESCIAQKKKWIQKISKVWR